MQQRGYVILGALAVLALYAVGFVVANSDEVRVDFLLFSASMSLIWVLLLSLVIGGLAGAGLILFARRFEDHPVDPKATMPTPAPPAEPRPPREVPPPL